MKILLVFFFTLLFTSANVSAQLLTYKHYDHKDGLHMASVNCIAQSKDGMIWLGTNGGDLIQFDGKTFFEVPLGRDFNHHFSNISLHKNEILFSSRYKGFYSYSLTEKELTKFDLQDYIIGDALRVFRKNGYTYFIGNRQILSKKGQEVNKLLFFKSTRNRLEVFQSFETPNSIILLTNYGGYRLFNGKVEKLSNWITGVPELEKYRFGYYSQNKIVLMQKEGNLIAQIYLDKKENVKQVQLQSISCSLIKDDRIESITYNNYYKQSTLLTASGEIHFLVDTSWQKIQHNYSETINQGHSIFADLNGDYWIPTYGSGIYKVSKEPFTKIELSKEFLSSAMMLPYVFPSGRILLSNFDSKTYIEKSANSHDFTLYNFSTLGITKVNETYYFATNHGLKEYTPTKSSVIQDKFYRTQTITSIFSHQENLWFGIAGDGLYKYDLSENKTSTPNVNGGRMPSHIYTSLLSSDGETIYFGTNSGVYELSLKTEVLQQVYFNSADLGLYSGLSTKDSYGNNWFSLEKGIVAITKNGETKTFQGEDLFNSTLFYTLIADDIGNLIIGTNKGLTIFKVDSNANILSHKVYDEKTNFLGYETNMRAQFKKGNEILLGTVEGVFQVNTQYLENLPRPLAPVISIINNTEEKKELDAFSFMFSLNNPKINSIYYSYSIDEGQWENLTNQESTLLISGLSSGEHVIKVRASYDGEVFGQSATKNLSVHVPLWKSPWFIGAIIAGLFLVNLILLNYYKAFNGGGLINTKDLDVHLNLTPAILLSAAITTPLTHILAPIMDAQLSLNIGTTLVTTFILVSLYISSISARSNKKMYLYSTLLKIGLFVLMTDFLWEVFDSKLHPYNIIGMILISSMAPYILSKIKDTAVFAVLVLFASIILIMLIKDDTVYPKYYFLLGISVSSFLMIFYSFLRYDSLEKLIFVSAIINKGNMPVIAFDQEGTVNYSSENIANFLDITHNEILDKNITVLNNFIPFDNTFKDRDITKEFKDGEKYLTPMVDKNSEVRWMEWAYRDFSQNVKLILGQDVTKKMELENTYELLVQHAEDFIYKCDNRGNFNFINNASIAKLGYAKEELIGTNSIRIVEESHRDEVVRFYREHFINKNMTSYKEFPIIKKNGERIWVGQSITTLYSPGSESQIEGFIALARDITEVRTQQRLIREQSESITSSINYARRIQHNLLPSINQFEESFKEHFIFSKPRDIVSGDFYWMEKIGDNTILVLGDCTGHGVPGSFMTLLGFNVLNSTVLENRITDPGKILNKVDKKLIEYLPRGTGKNLVNDAMELTICVFNDKTNDLAYACAGSRFLIHEDGEFTMYKGDNKHAGDTEEGFPGYNTHFASFTSDFNIFLFSDGFQDQFGGAKDKKYSFRRLLELFEENINLPLSEQQRLITDSFEKWIGDAEQTDDVTVVSVKRAILKENNSQ